MIRRIVARMRVNAVRMARRRGPYEAFTLILAVTLPASGQWLAAILVALVLIAMRGRVTGTRREGTERRIR